VPVILAYAGRRAESLPEGSGEVLAGRVRRLLNGLAPTAVVGPAADGGDLLVLETALALPDAPIAHVVLPTSVQDFREASVAEEWRDRYDRVLQHVPLAGGDIRTLGLPDGDDAYRQANRQILETAAVLATDPQRAVALVIATEEEGEMVRDFTAQAALQGIPVLRIDPAVELPARPHCFVAMPFGRKYDPQRKITIDCDQVYERILVPALENAQLRFRRADEQIDSGVVLQPMIEAISEADLVIADLASANFNVGWELGLRHLLRARHTLLMLPSRTLAPFDISALRHVSYEQGETGITDDAAIATWEALAPYLRLAAEPAALGSDSPVDAVMEVTQWARVKPRHTRDERWEAIREQLSLARDLRDSEMMLQILGEADSLDAHQRELVAAEAGVGLVRLGSYQRGRGLLQALIDGDPEVLRPAAHLFYAQSIYKPAGATIAEFDDAERLLKHLLRKRPGYPEVWAGLGAISKRRSKLRDTPALAEGDIRKAMDAYQHDYARDLNCYYEGINLVACAVVLANAFADQSAGERARNVLPAVRLAAQLAWERNPADFWAAVTVAEARLCAALLGADDTENEVHDAYEFAGRCKPPSGDLDSSVTQLRLLIEHGVPRALMDIAAAGLSAGAGVPVTLDEPLTEAPPTLGP
jgi:tetratricopeptide (TPR) repeat protein